MKAQTEVVILMVMRKEPDDYAEFYYWVVLILKMFRVELWACPQWK